MSDETLLAQNADLKLDHAEPSSMVGYVVKLQSVQDWLDVAWLDCSVQRSGRVGVQVVQNDGNGFDSWKESIDQVAHTFVEVDL